MSTDRIKAIDEVIGNLSGRISVCAGRSHEGGCICAELEAEILKLNVERFNLTQPLRVETMRYDGSGGMNSRRGAEKLRGQ